MLKDSKTGAFGNYEFWRKYQNFAWKTTLIPVDSKQRRSKNHRSSIEPASELRTDVGTLRRKNQLIL